jgi:hypothetical protein
VGRDGYGDDSTAVALTRAKNFLKRGVIVLFYPHIVHSHLSATV